MQKRCVRCETLKDLTEFYKCRDGFLNKCKKCTKEYYQKNKLHILNYVKNYFNTPKGKRIRKNRHLLQRYGITISQYEQMIKDQNNKCSICGKEPTKRQLSVDHDHKTGKIRGLLCNNCNHAIGKFDDDVILMIKAINYILKYQS